MSGEHEREADGGDLSFDAIEEAELPEWATDGASVPDDPDGSDRTGRGNGPESSGGATDADPQGADASDGGGGGSASVNFANVQTGASESVAVDDGGKRVTAPSVDAPDAVAFSGPDDHEDTAGTSLRPDLDDVDPGEFLDETDDGSFPRPGSDGAGPAGASAGGTTGGTTASAGAQGPTSRSSSGATRSPRGATGPRAAEGTTAGTRLGGRESVLPADPALAFGLGMGVMLVVAAAYLFLANALGGLVAAVLLVGAVLVVGGGAYALDLFDERG